MLLAAASLLFVAVAPGDKFDAKLRDAIAARYPDTTIVASCGGSTLGRPGGVAALRDYKQNAYRVVWAGKSGGLRELDSIPVPNIVGNFELQCLSPHEAKERKRALRESEGVRDYLKAPAGKGAFCYFIDATETRCWSFDHMGNVIDAGGWQT